MYYFLKIQALRRWTLMYVIRFSKIKSISLKSSIERLYNMIHDYLFVNFLLRKISAQRQNRHNATLLN